MKVVLLAIVALMSRSRVLVAYTTDHCKSWTEPGKAYSVCLPENWYTREMPSGALFLCDDKRGDCVIRKGGGPLLGHAIVSLAPSEILLPTPPSTVEQFAHEFNDRDLSSQFSDQISIQGRFTVVKYVLVSQIYLTGALNERPQVVKQYFAEIDHKMLQVVLTYNSEDQRSKYFEANVFNVVTSLHRVRNGNRDSLRK